MPPLPLRIAQTSNEAKKQYKQNGPRIPEHQLKQLERGHELDARAARLRDAEDRRRAAKKKREEREAKEKAARRQMGVGLATQLVGYSHTQAQLKSGMEAFLGLKRRKKKEEGEGEGREDAELAKKLEEIVHKIEKEPWDNDDDDDNADCIALDLPWMNAPLGEQYVDDDLDDDTLLEAHDMLISDPVAAPALELRPPPPTPSIGPLHLRAVPIKDDADFTRLHGPINKTVENILDGLPEPLVELLSQDISMKLPDWDPAPGLLHKLNPLGLPPHRLRIKVGSVVTLLRDLNTSSQLSKSQYMRVLRAGNDRLECLVLDGQLEGTKAVLTRIAFPTKYRNDDLYPFKRIQFPVRIAIDYTPPRSLRITTQAGSKLPVRSDPMQASRVLEKPTSVVPNVKPQLTHDAAFRLPGLPASKAVPPASLKPTLTSHLAIPLTAATLDGWDDFLESGTQIARELSSETTDALIPPPSFLKTSPSLSESLPPLSTQDLDFSMDDLEDVVTLAVPERLAVTTNETIVNSNPLCSSRIKAVTSDPNAAIAHAPLPPTTSTRKPSKDKGSTASLKPKPPTRKVKANVVPIDLTALTSSQKPRSVPDHHPKMFKRKACAHAIERAPPSAKRPRVQPLQPLAACGAPGRRDSISDFSISTQEATSFFDVDDEGMFGGSPPIPA